jgi:cytidine deaminase
MRIQVITIKGKLMTLDKQDHQLIKEAKQASKNAYAPYSNFKVGTALLLANGEIIIGANVENCSYSPTNCAERSALFAAYSQGFRKGDITKIVVVTDTPIAASPCGVCRQVMSELIESECPIILTNYAETDIKISNIKELLPYTFTL